METTDKINASKLEEIWDKGVETNLLDPGSVFNKTISYCHQLETEIKKLKQSISPVPETLTKEILQNAFVAGEEFGSECHCGECDYCIQVKNEDAPDFETWHKDNISDISSQSETGQSSDHKYKCPICGGWLVCNVCTKELCTPIDFQNSEKRIKGRPDPKTVNPYETRRKSRR